MNRILVTGGAGFIVLLSIFLFCISILPCELEFEVQNPQYMEFYLYQDQSVLGNAKYSLCGSAFCDSSEDAQMVKLRFINGRSPEYIAIQCGYEPVMFKICSDVTYRRYGIFSYKLKKNDFLNAYRPMSMPEHSSDGQFKIKTSGNENIFYPQKAEIEKNIHYPASKFQGWHFCFSLFCYWGMQWLFSLSGNGENISLFRLFQAKNRRAERCCGCCFSFLQISSSMESMLLVCY